MKMIWILVANQAEAQIYSSGQLPGNILLVDVLANKEGTAHPGDLISDAPGRAFDSTGSGRHAMEPNTGVKEEQRRRFVKEMVDRLQAAHLKGDFAQLVLLAAPAVLGVIRKSLVADLKKIVIKEIPKDVIGQDVGKIQSQLARAFALR
ncbi:MAG: host attachment protein [Xanthomonadales bacterium]|nr:host attachment protein [Xanthomonadales bacterium]